MNNQLAIEQCVRISRLFQERHPEVDFSTHVTGNDGAPLPAEVNLITHFDPSMRYIIEVDCGMEPEWIADLFISALMQMLKLHYPQREVAFFIRERTLLEHCSNNAQQRFQSVHWRCE